MNIKVYGVQDAEIAFKRTRIDSMALKCLYGTLDRVEG